MAKEFLPLFLDFNETTQDLTDEECGRLVRAIVEYANGNDCESKLCGAERIAFRFLKGTVDRNQAISEVRRQARQGKTQQKETNDNKKEQKEQNSQPKNNNKNKNKNKNENKDDESDPPKRFAPPTVEEVTAYCRERKNGVNPERFIDFYASKGWKVGNQPMKDWHAAVRTWEQREETPNKGQAKTVVAQQYGQRDYSTAGESMEEVLARLEV